MSHSDHTTLKMDCHATSFVPGAEKHVCRKPESLTMLCVHMTDCNSAEEILDGGVLKAHSGACRDYPIGVYTQPVFNYSEKDAPYAFATDYGLFGFVFRVTKDTKVAALVEKFIANTDEIFDEVWETTRSGDDDSSGSEDEEGERIVKVVVEEKTTTEEVFRRCLESRMANMRLKIAPAGRKPYSCGHSSNLIIPHEVALDAKSPELVCVFSCVARATKEKSTLHRPNIDVEYSVSKKERVRVETLCKEKNIPFFMDVHNEKELVQKLTKSELF